MVNNTRKPGPGGGQPDHDDLDDRELGSDMDYFDDPEAILAAEAAEEAALVADELDPEKAKKREDIPTLKAQVAELTDRLLRAHADMDNQRKMAAKEREDTAKYAISKFAADIVQVGDNFNRAISAVPADAVDNDPALKSFLDGVVMLDREFHNILERHNIQRLEPTGEAFDPHFHQAMMEQEDTTVPHGTVLQVFQAGYVLADRVLRPAMVVVAKGGVKPGADAPKSEPPSAANENTEAGGAAASTPPQSGQAPPEPDSSS